MSKKRILTMLLTVAMVMTTFSFNNEVLANPNAEVDGSTKVLQVAGRENSWDTPAIKVTDFQDKFQVGDRITMRVWVYQNSGSSQQFQLVSAEDSYAWLGNANIPTNQWTILKASHEITAKTDMIYLETGDPKVDFLVGDLQIKSENNELMIRSGHETQEYWFPNGGPGIFGMIELPEGINKPGELEKEEAITEEKLELPPMSLDETPPLKDQFSFPIGVAVKDPSYFTDERKSALIKHHFDSITAENVMKPAYVQPLEGQFKFDETQAYIDFAKENNMRLRGHTLVWHNQHQEWMFEGLPTDKEGQRKLLLERMESHITNVMVHAGDDVDVWDVVNEAIGDDQPYGMRKSKYYELIGPDYVEQAFRIADKVRKDNNLKVKLYYNDYNNQEHAGKREAILKLIRDMVEAGVPIDGVGLQGHVGNNFGKIEGMDQSLRGYLDLGLEVDVTELDITVYQSHEAEDAPITQEALIYQAYRYKEIADLLNDLNNEFPGKVQGFTLWGLTDDGSWLNYFMTARTDAPLLFDQYDQPKLAYWALVDESKLPVLIQEVKSYEGRVEVDAEDELTWQIQAPTPISKTSDIGSFKTAWKANTLYAWIEIMDKKVNPEDGIILYVDKKVTISRNGQVDTDNVLAKVKETDKGYVVETAIELQEDIVRVEGIGFDLGVINGDKITRWNDMSHQADAKADKYGKLLPQGMVKTTKAIKGTPKLGGEIDRIWDTANEITTDIYTQNTTGAKAKVKTLWDEDYLYVLAKVWDSNLNDQNKNPWEQDSVEIFIDENLHRTDYYEDDDVQYRVNFNNVVTINGGPEDSKFQSAAKIIDGGYYIEMSIPHNIQPFKTGQIMGFDVQVNDDHGSGNRDSMTNWYDDTGVGYQNTENLGIIILENESDTSGDADSTFADVPKTHWAYEAISDLAAKAIVSSAGEKQFAPNQAVTGAEFIAMLVASDFTNLDQEIASNDLMTREEMFALMYMVLEENGHIEKVDKGDLTMFTDADEIAPYAKEAITQLVQVNIVGGMDNNQVNPQEVATRAQAAALIHKALTN